MFPKVFEKFLFTSGTHVTFQIHRAVYAHSITLSENHLVWKIRFVEGKCTIHLGMERKRDFDGFRPRQRGIVLSNRLALGIGVGHVHLKTR